MLIDVIYCSYGEFDDERAVGPAQWPHFDLLFIHDGEVRLLIDDNPLDVSRGQAVLLFPHTRFQGRITRGITKASVHHFWLPDSPSEATCAPLDQYYGKESGYVFLDSKGKPQIERDLDRSIRALETAPKSAAKALQSHLLCVVLIQLQYLQQLTSSPISPSQKVLMDITLWLSENLDRTISLAEMAERANLSESHFRRIFRQRFGVGPAGYHQNLRIKEACRLLHETIMPIKTIADKLGYDDLAHFYRAFKRFVNLSPAQYRKTFSPAG